MTLNKFQLPGTQGYLVLLDQIKKLTSENIRYRSALEFYAELRPAFFVTIENMSHLSNIRKTLGSFREVSAYYLTAKEALNLSKETMSNLEQDAIETIKNIKSRLICIGGPFNDNKHLFNKEQLCYLKPILDACEDFLDRHFCYECERGK